MPDRGFGAVRFMRLQLGVGLGAKIKAGSQLARACLPPRAWGACKVSCLSPVVWQQLRDHSVGACRFFSRGCYRQLASCGRNAGVAHTHARTKSDSLTRVRSHAYAYVCTRARACRGEARRACAQKNTHVHTHTCGNTFAWGVCAHELAGTQAGGLMDRRLGEWAVGRAGGQATDRT